MEDKFLKGLDTVSAYKETENGAFALSTTHKSLLDLFGTIGALRRRDDSDVINLFTKAYVEDRLLAMKILFYARDVRGGLGERRVFRTIASWLAKNHKEDIKLNLQYIPEFGRWDDLYVFVGTPIQEEAMKVLKEQFEKDLVGMAEKKEISLLAKWLKSVNTSSKESRLLGRLTAKAFGLTEKDYRKKLSDLRKYLFIVEKTMSKNEWGNINYNTVPSYAAKNYSAAFMKHDEKRYQAYLDALTNPEVGSAKINADTLFPYDLVREYGYDSWCYSDTKKVNVDQRIEAQWKALPNYVTDGKKFLVMADTSSSMSGLPMETSVGLAIYFAEHNTGAYHGKFITFTEKPRFFDLKDELTLREKINLVLHKDNVGYNTNLEKAFELVLNSAVQNHCSQEDLPEAILVISDMEIDRFGSYEENTTFTTEMKRRFADAGYKMPTLVYWNVNARFDTFHAEASDDVRFVSGSSAAIFKGLCDHMGSTAEELMLATLDVERYSVIKVA